jgi:hypothetical protein
MTESFFSSPPSQRALLLAVVHCYGGISTGSCFGMVIMDAAYGFPVSVLKLVAGLCFCLGLCVIMIVYYDLEDKALPRNNMKVEIPNTSSSKERSHPKDNQNELLEPLMA